MAQTNNPEGINQWTGKAKAKMKQAGAIARTVGLRVKSAAGKAAHATAVGAVSAKNEIGRRAKRGAFQATDPSIGIKKEARLANMKSMGNRAKSDRTRARVTGALHMASKSTTRKRVAAANVKLAASKVGAGYARAANVGTRVGRFVNSMAHSTIANKSESGRGRHPPGMTHTLSAGDQALMASTAAAHKRHKMPVFKQDPRNR